MPWIPSALLSSPAAQMGLSAVRSCFFLFFDVAVLVILAFSFLFFPLQVFPYYPTRQETRSQLGRRVWVLGKLYLEGTERARGGATSLSYRRTPPCPFPPSLLLFFFSAIFFLFCLLIPTCICARPSLALLTAVDPGLLHFLPSCPPPTAIPSSSTLSPRT